MAENLLIVPLLVTEKFNPAQNQRDGGARLVKSMHQAFGESLKIMQFGKEIDPQATWQFDYPFDITNRFERRMANAKFIAEKIQEIEGQFTHVFFVHISMQFGLVYQPLEKGPEVWTFPMFLTPSYVASGEHIPDEYFEMEQLALSHSDHIITPSPLERKQLLNEYSVPEEKIHVIPRGVDMGYFRPKKRSIEGEVLFASIGSVKPQKNTLELVDLFSRIHLRYPDAQLKIIGPIQNPEYYKELLTKIHRLQLEEWVQFTGFIPPHQIASIIENDHIHLSCSSCETFGRSIFETLASGMPNIARIANNAAAEFLGHLPYARFVNNHEEALTIIEWMIQNYSQLSEMALEIGNLYDDNILSKRLFASICSKNTIAISDFDGTLYHKDDPKRTERCIAAFGQYSLKVLCSARPIDDLLEQMKLLNLEVDWIIGSSGSIVTDSKGHLLWCTPLDTQSLIDLKDQMPTALSIDYFGETLQLKTSVEELKNILGFRFETYGDDGYISHWKASKLHAVHQLLKRIDWDGQIRVFGDGPYDRELLTYFDGTLITPFPENNLQKKEIEYV